MITFVCGSNINSMVSRLQSDLDIDLGWVSNNGMVANPDKFQAIFLGIKMKVSLFTQVLETSQAQRQSNFLELLLMTS